MSCLFTSNHLGLPILLMVGAGVFVVNLIAVTRPMLPVTPDEVAAVAMNLTVDLDSPAYASDFRYSKSNEACKVDNPDIASAVVQAFERGDTRHKTVTAGRYITGRPADVAVCRAWLFDQPTPAAQQAVALWIAQSHQLEVQAVRAPAFLVPR